MVLSHKRSPFSPISPLMLESHSLEREVTFKYLGILFKQDLSWSSLIQLICSRANTGSPVQKILQSCFNRGPFATIYITLVRPHLEYAAVIWIPCLRKVKYCKKRMSMQRSSLPVSTISACHMDIAL